MPKNFEEQYRYTQNRELSWLRNLIGDVAEPADRGFPHFWPQIYNALI